MTIWYGVCIALGVLAIALGILAWHLPGSVDPDDDDMYGPR